MGTSFSDSSDKLQRSRSASRWSRQSSPQGAGACRSCRRSWLTWEPVSTTLRAAGIRGPTSPTRSSILGERRTSLLSTARGVRGWSALERRPAHASSSAIHGLATQLSLASVFRSACPPRGGCVYATFLNRRSGPRWEHSLRAKSDNQSSMVVECCVHGHVHPEGLGGFQKCLCLEALPLQSLAKAAQPTCL